MNTYRKQWLNEQAAEEYDAGIQKLVKWYDKCLNKHSDNIEEYFKVTVY